MEDIGKRRLAAAAAAAVGIAYFLVCARPLCREYVLAPVWRKPLAAAGRSAGALASPGAKVFPFRLGGDFGYFDASGRVLFASPVDYGVALAPDSYALYDRLSTGFSIRSPAGAELARCALPGYPFFAAGRRFLLAPDQCGVSELGTAGKAAWTRTFGSVITAFDASPSLAVFGLMDGSVVGLGPGGEELLSFAPGGSRVAGVYGTAVSPDGNLVAVVCGLDKQRLVVLEKRSSAYRVTYHRWLESDFRRPVAMAFTADGRWLAYEAPGGAGVYDRRTRKETLVAAPSAAALGESLAEEGMLVLFSGEGASRRLVCASPDDRRLVDLPLSAERAFLEIDGRSVFLGLDGAVVRMDLREE